MSTERVFVQTPTTERFPKGREEGWQESGVFKVAVLKVVWVHVGKLGDASGKANTLVLMGALRRAT